MLKKLLYQVLSALTIICLFFLLTGKDVAAEEEKLITDGVYIETVHVGGMTLTEAKEAVNIYVEDLKSKTISIEIDDEEIEKTKLGDLGFSNKDYDYLDKAINIGKSGNLFQRYKEMKDVDHNNLKYTLEYTFDKKKIREYVETNLAVYDIQSINASIKREGGKFVYTDSAPGRHIQLEETSRLIEESISDNWDKEDIIISAIVLIKEPEYTREMVEKVDSVLGKFTTNYSSSSKDRAQNLANGAKLVNNTLLYPGEEFNAYDILAPFTINNGYSVGTAYQNGMLVDSIGGGACQVTTTLYNTALYAELEITERAAHSMTVSYVDLAKDAAIAGTYKNLRFVNNTDYPILVQGYTKNRNITFAIWGHETRPANRKVEYETKLISTKEPPEDVVTKDPTQLTTYRKSTQSPKTGYVAELYKVVYEDGKQVSKERVNKSSYMAAPRYVTIGTIPVPEPTPEPESDNEEDLDKSETVNTDNVDPVESEEQVEPVESEESVETLEQAESSKLVDKIEE